MVKFPDPQPLLEKAKGLIWFLAESLLDKRFQTPCCPRSISSMDFYSLRGRDSVHSEMYDVIKELTLFFGTLNINS